MTPPPKTEADHISDAIERLVNAALDHVTFDGWSQATLEAAIKDTDLDPTLVSQACPRGAVDLAVAFHRMGDLAMLEAFEDTDQTSMRYSERVALGVRLRLEAVSNKEAVRRGMALFALPHNMAEGSRLIWGTADTIWNALGDTSKDINWYSKRTILSGVYSSTVLYWLGDDSEGHADTWEFLDRRIANVMQFEVFKSKVTKIPLVERFMAGPGSLFDRVVAPSKTPPSDLPGHWPTKE
jgi:ubiquinone biosynthesis protein COQ9